MFTRAVGAALLAALASGPAPALAQQGITVLDEAQDATPSPCGARPITIARMQWPSAAILAEIHARLLATQLDCDARVTPADMATTGSSMASTGQPAVAPELWVTRIANVWNEAMASQSVRPAADTFTSEVFEAWYIPDYLANAQPDLTSAESLATASFDTTEPIRFISCPPDWGCSVINRNLLAAYGLTDLFEIVEPANRLEMDQLIAGAVSRQEPFVAYYWQPNAVLDQFGFVELDMGAYDEEALQCLARVECADPQPSAFAAESVVIALAEWVFLDAPDVAAYFQRASLPLAEMNALLASLNQAGATPESIAEQFIAEREEVWRPWVDAGQ